MKDTTRKMIATLHSYHNEVERENIQPYRNLVAKMFRKAKKKKWWIRFLRNGGIFQ